MVNKMIGLNYQRLIQIWNLEITRMVFASIAAHSNSISVGLTQGYSAVLLPQLASPNSSILISKDESSWIAGLGVISTPFGALLSGILAEILGRKSTIIITSLPFLIGWIMTALANDVKLLYLGRIVSGLAAGMTTASYLYVAEISSKEHRSLLSAFGPIFVSLGVLAVYTLGFVTSWQKTALISTLFSVVTVFLTISVPESPAWYVSRKQFDNAYRSLNWLLQNDKNSEVELSNLVKFKFESDETKDNATNSVDKAISKKAVLKLKDYINAMSSPVVYKPFIILLLFFFFQEGSGIYIFLFYSNQIFKEFGTDYDENLISVSVAVFRFFMSILGAFLMSKIGRRPLGIFSGICMSITMLVVCIYEFVSGPSQHVYHAIPFICILFHVGFSMTGFLQLPWILTSELFPISHRGFLSGVVSSIAYVFIFISVKIYPDLLPILQLHGLLWGFFIMSSTGALFLYFFLPETKNKTLEEISDSFLKEKSSTEKGKSSISIEKIQIDFNRVKDQHLMINNFVQKEIADLEIVLDNSKLPEKNMR